MTPAVDASEDRLVDSSRGLLAALLAICATGAAMAVALFPFTAEDAFIVARYARNLSHDGAFVFNLGEPISALTSPLHALLVALFYAVFGETVISNKIFGLLAAGAACWLLARASRGDRLATLASLAVVGLSPFVLMWAVGGLETPLLLVLVTILAALCYSLRCDETWRLSSGLIVFGLGGLIFLTRFDAALFIVPVGLLCLSRMPLRRAIPAAIPAIVVVGAWMLFSWSYFGDIFPTSFHVKTPRNDLRWMAGNGLYLVDLYLVTGLAALHVAFAAIVSYQPHLWRRVVVPHLRQLWWGYGGLALVGLYGLLTARTHMMFGYRLLTPYLPVAALLSADLMTRLRSGAGRHQRAVSHLLAVAVGLVCAVQVVGFLQVYSQSAGGGRNSELRYTDAMEATAAVAAFLAPEAALRTHWDLQPASRGRAARVQTFAAGILPFHLPGMAFYDSLTAYRHHCRPEIEELRRSSDYFLVMQPGWEPDERIDRYLGSYELIAATPLRVEYVRPDHFQHFDRRILVFFNRHPDPWRLPPTIDAPCLD